MTSRRLFCGALLVAICCGTGHSAPLDNNRLDAIVRPVADQDYLQAVVVGIVDDNGPRIRAFGRLSDQDGRVPDGDTIFEIGSVSKVFTSLLLADAVQRSVKLDDSLQKYLPQTVRLKEKGRPITLLDLSTHRSGLPRLPGNMVIQNQVDPYAGYTPQKLYDYLNQWQPVYVPGEHVEYSNLAVGVLGHVLALRAGVGYEQLLSERITRPLQMGDTSITLNDSQQKRLAPPHDSDGNVVGNWWFPDPLAGCGGIRSSGNDMLRFVQAQLLPPGGPLGEAVSQTHLRRGGYDAQYDIALGWLMDRRGFLFHNGATGGYHSFVAFNPGRKVGVVVLSNNVGGWTDRIGIQLICHLLGVDSSPAPAVHQTIPLDAAKLDRFTGHYLMGLSLLTIRREGNQLFAMIMGQPELRIYPKSESSCFWKAIDVQADFTFDPDGKARQLVWRQDGRSTRALRIPTTMPATNTSGK